MKRSLYAESRALVRHNAWFLGVTVVFVGLAVLYSLILPIGESDHERSHVRYIQYIRTHQELPPLGYVWPSVPTADECEGTGVVREAERQFRQPPLYYVLNALVSSWLGPIENWWPAENLYGYHSLVFDGGVNAYIHDPVDLASHPVAVREVYLYRFVSILLGVLGLVATYCTGLLVLPSKRNVGAAAMAAAVAFIPTYVFVSSVVTNDILVGVLGLWCVYFCLKSVLFRAKVVYLLLATALLLLAFFAKYTAIFIVPMYLLTTAILLFNTWNARSRTRTAITSISILVLTLLVVVFLVSFWHTLSTGLHGYEGISTDIFKRLFALNDLSRSNALLHIYDRIWFSFITYWGLLGADSIVLTKSLLYGLVVLTLVAIAGVFVKIIRKRVDHNGLTVLFLAIVTIVANWCLYYLMFDYGVRGRYVISNYSLIAFVLVFGMSAWGTERFRWFGGYLLGVLLLVLSTVTAFAVLKPAYDPPQREVEFTLQPNETLTHAVFGGFAELMALSLQPDPISPVDTVEVTLVWRPVQRTVNNYVIGVYLEGLDQTNLGGTAHLASNGNYSTSLWHPGEVIRDTYRFTLQHDTTVGPTIAAHAKITMYCPTAEGDKYLPVRDLAGQAVGQEVFGQPVRIERSLPAGKTASQRDVFSSKLAQFADAAVLTNGRLPSTAQRAGWAVPVMLRWRTLGAVSGEIKASVQILDGAGKWVAGDDKILSPVLPSALWKPGDLLTIVHWVELPADLPSGLYRVVVTVYDSATSARLGGVDGDGLPLSDNAVTLGDITVQ